MKYRWRRPWTEPPVVHSFTILEHHWGLVSCGLLACSNSVSCSHTYCILLLLRTLARELQIVAIWLQILFARTLKLETLPGRTEFIHLHPPHWNQIFFLMERSFSGTVTDLVLCYILILLLCAHAHIIYLGMPLMMIPASSKYLSTFGFLVVTLSVDSEYIFKRKLHTTYRQIVTLIEELSG